MKTRSILALTAVAGLATAANAQFITTAGISAQLTLSWVEDPAFAHNDNGVLETGERALILMNAAFTANNPDVSFNPPIGTFTHGTVLGLASCYLDLRSAAGDATGAYNGGVTAPTGTSTGPNAGNTGTSGYGVRGLWRLGGAVANGTPASNGFQNIGPGQLPPDPSSANTTNPISNLERLGWAPASYSTRTQTFAVSPAGGTAQAVGLYMDLDGVLGGAAYLQNTAVTFGSVNIPIAPAPGSLALLGLGGLVLARRRR